MLVLLLSLYCIGLFSCKSASVFTISLHWLRIPELIFKLAVLTYRAIHGAGPSYFQSCFTRVVDMPSRRRLRSSGSDRLHVPIIRRYTVGSRTFTASGAAVWNDLPAHVTAAPSLAVFRSSDSALRHFCSRAHTLTLSVILQTMYFSKPVWT